MTAFTLDDVLTIEQDEDASPAEVSTALQRAINGNQWSLQGSYGRSMMDAINSGRCLLGRNDCHDYYGNHIPSRAQVQSGTKGSYEFVVKHMGKEYADQMQEV
jgi:hypothetical protein